MSDGNVVDLNKPKSDKSKSGPKPPPAAKRPPGRPSNAARGAVAQAESTARLERRSAAVLGLFNLAQMPAMLTGQLADVAAYNEHGPKIANEAARIGEHHEKFGELIDKLEIVGPYAGLVLATAPLVLQLMLNHGRLPESSAAAFAGLGVVSPKLLEAQTLEMMAAAQAQADAEAAEIRERYAEMAAERAGAGGE